MKPQPPLVSIIIPTYNSRQWLGEAVDSALGQTYPECEVLVVDDGSTDGTGEWLARRYGERIHYLWKENSGLASARNFGLKHARGKYVQFLDADDLLRSEKVATHVDYLENHPEIAVVYCHCLYFYDDQVDQTFEGERKHLYRSGQVFRSMVERGYLLIHMALSVREWLDRVGPFDETFASAEDRDYWLRLAWAGATFRFLDGEPLVLYRLRTESMSQNRVNHGCENIRLTQKIRGYVTDPNEQRRLRLDRAEGYWRFAYGRALFASGQRWAGWREMLKGLWADRRGLVYKLGLLILIPVLGNAQADRALGTARRALFRLKLRGDGA